MKMLADENLYEPIIVYLREIGNEVISIRNSQLSGVSDDTVYKKACEEKLVIITMDKDFTRMFLFPPEKCGGIIVVKIYKRTLDETLSIFKKFFKPIPEQEIIKNLVIITPEGVRIRKSTLNEE